MVGVGEVIQRLKPIVTTAERALDATSSIRVDDGLNRGIGAHSEDEDTTPIRMTAMIDSIACNPLKGLPRFILR
jgi:hypothetical protein